MEVHFILYKTIVTWYDEHEEILGIYSSLPRLEEARTQYEFEWKNNETMQRHSKLETRYEKVINKY